MRTVALAPNNPWDVSYVQVPDDFQYADDEDFRRYSLNQRSKADAIARQIFAVHAVAPEIAAHEANILFNPTSTPERYIYNCNTNAQSTSIHVQILSDASTLRPYVILWRGLVWQNPGWFVFGCVGVGFEIAPSMFTMFQDIRKAQRYRDGQDTKPRPSMFERQDRYPL